VKIVAEPQRNAYVERFNRTVRYDWLPQTLLWPIQGVKDVATRWLWTYNHEGPNIALGGITPAHKLAMSNCFPHLNPGKTGDCRIRGCHVAHHYQKA
jgi:putative transposase